MTRLFSWLLPQWGANPLLDYTAAHRRGEPTGRAFIIQLLLILAVLAATALLYASLAGLMARRPNITLLIWQSLYFPVLTLQTLTAIAAILQGAHALSALRHGKTWDHLRVTESGAGLALRAAWLSILHRLRAPIAAILLARLALGLGMLFDLSAFSGGYLGMLGAQAMTPSLDWRLNLLSAALSLAAAAMLPITMIALCAALGILLSLVSRSGLVVTLCQMALVIGLVVFVCVSSLAVAQLLRAQLTLPAGLGMPLFLAYSGLGDWGFALVQLGSLGALWQALPMGLLAGPALAAMALGQALAADGLMRLAERLAEARA